jgi:hypothetical protein
MLQSGNFGEQLTGRGEPNRYARRAWLSGEISAFPTRFV